MNSPRQKHDVLVIGGGPAGSSCAWRLQVQGVDVAIVDRAEFPRDKVCGGWITPQVCDALELDLDEYGRQRILQPISAFRVGLIEDDVAYIDYNEPVSYAIRRCEFDEYLLRRSEVRTYEGVAVQDLEHTPEGWLVNARLHARYLIGAGGHFCPVARQLRRTQSQADGGVAGSASAPIVFAQEAEYRLTGGALSRCGIAPEVPELYFYPDLQGYAWCVRKRDYLNVGLGRVGERSLKEYRQRFLDWLLATGRLTEPPAERFHGHAYRLNIAPVGPHGNDDVLLIGDALGLAGAQSGEGIYPAILSGLIAADVLAESVHTGEDIFYNYVQRLEQALQPASPTPDHESLLGQLRVWAAAKLLRRSWFLRHVLLDRWFLHRSRSITDRDNRDGSRRDAHNPRRSAPHTVVSH